MGHNASWSDSSRVCNLGTPQRETPFCFFLLSSGPGSSICFTSLSLLVPTRAWKRSAGCPVRSFQVNSQITADKCSNWFWTIESEFSPFSQKWVSKSYQWGITSEPDGHLGAGQNGGLSVQLSLTPEEEEWVGAETDCPCGPLDLWFPVLTAHWSHLVNFRCHWSLGMTFRNSDLIGLECGLGMESFLSIRRDSATQPSLRTTTKVRSSTKYHNFLL